MARTLRPRVFVTRQLPGEALGRLSRHVEFQVTLLTDRVDADPLARSPSLRVAGNGAVDHLLAALDGRRAPHCVNPENYE